jgi:hypothetical protein
MEQAREGTKSKERRASTLSRPWPLFLSKLPASSASDFRFPRLRSVFTPPPPLYVPAKVEMLLGFAGCFLLIFGCALFTVRWNTINGKLTGLACIGAGANTYYTTLNLLDKGGMYLNTTTVGEPPLSPLPSFFFCRRRIRPPTAVCLRRNFSTRRTPLDVQREPSDQGREAGLSFHVWRVFMPVCAGSWPHPHVNWALDLDIFTGLPISTDRKYIIHRGIRTGARSML